MWGMKVYLTCKQLVERDSSVCRYDSVQKYCCSSCGSVKIAEGENNAEIEKKHSINKYKCICDFIALSY